MNVLKLCSAIYNILVSIFSVGTRRTAPKKCERTEWKRYSWFSMFFFVFAGMGCAQSGSVTIGSPSHDLKIPVKMVDASCSASIVDSASSTEVASKPLVLEIGIYVLDIGHLDMKENQFFADFYIWAKWEENPDYPWNIKHLEFMNGTIEWASEVSTYTVWNGKKCESQRLKGVFRGKFDLRTYPFDSQTLSIALEDNEYSSGKCKFVIDPANPDVSKWVESTIEVPDWRFSGARVKEDVHCYETNFGDDDPSDNEPFAKFGRFVFQVKMKRLFVPHCIKFIIPLLVIAGMAYTVFFISAKEFEAQCGISVTALLTAVALHMSQADALPSVGYLVTSDKIFILFYLAIFSTIVQTVAANNSAKRGQIEMAMKLDNLFQIFYPVFLIGGIAAVLIF